MIQNELQAWEGELIGLRRDFHTHPELAFEEHRTSAIVAEKLRGWGYQVAILAGTGVVGTLTRGQGKRIGLRADMDALPILEATDAEYASATPGKMHACGHDGHTVMLLGAARFLAEHGKFTGTLNVIFQPAEENIGGANRMIEQGLFDQFPCDAIFALHNLPGLAAGHIMVKPGSVMAACDVASVTIRGRGGHGAAPQFTSDCIVAAASIVQALQTLVSRNVSPVDPAVVTVGSFHAGTTATIIPETAQLEIGIRTCSRDARDLLEKRLHALVHAQAQSYGCTAEIAYDKSYPATINSRAETQFVADTARALNLPLVEADAPLMFSEDFAFMLEKVPGSYFFLGMGDEADRPFLHDPGYDFNDTQLTTGAAFFAHLVERYLTPEAARP
ncbi:MAG: M20 family metallopeptidase [Aestuariivirgaceae bacterium]|nr:M20 family metallopeptidase [Aestuariivirgaceae bacterium]